MNAYSSRGSKIVCEIVHSARLEDVTFHPDLFSSMKAEAIRNYANASEVTDTEVLASCIM